MRSPDNPPKPRNGEVRTRPLRYSSDPKRTCERSRMSNDGIGRALTSIFAGAMTGAAAPVMRTDSTPTYVPESEKAQANGVASLDANAHVYVNQIPPGFATLDGNGQVFQSQPSMVQ